MEEQAAFDGFHPGQPGQHGHQLGGHANDQDNAGQDEKLLGGLSDRGPRQWSQLLHRRWLNRGEGGQLARVGWGVKGWQVWVRRVGSVLPDSPVAWVHSGSQELLTVISFACHLSHIGCFSKKLFCLRSRF